MTPTTGTVDLGSFAFDCGRTIPSLEIAYAIYGEYTGDNAVLVCHALTGSQYVAGGDVCGQAGGWWTELVGPGRQIDTDEYAVLCANVPGSCYGTTGPTSTNPETGRPYGPDFPPVTVADWVEAQRGLCDALGIDRLHAVVGGSVGGMNVLEWAARYPERVDRIAPIATAARLDAQCLALEAIARRAIVVDPHYDGGRYYGPDHPEPDEGLALARQLGHVMYRSKAGMEAQFGRDDADRADVGPFAADPGGEHFPARAVESYLEYQADRFVERFDANAYLAMTRAMDAYDLAEGRESEAAALADFDGQALLLSFTHDWHFPPALVGDLASVLRTAGVGTAHCVVDSTYGHDAFLVETDAIGSPIADFLADGIAGDAVREASGRPDPGVDRAPVHAGLLSR